MPNYTVVDEARDLIKPYVDTGDSAQESLTRSTVGWTGKNKFSGEIYKDGAYLKNVQFILPAGDYTFSFKNESDKTVKYWAASASDFTDKGDKYVSAGETATQKYTLGSGGKVEFGFRFDPQDSSIATTSISEVMITDARIKDSTYEPYHESVEVEFEEEIHGVNLLNVGSNNRTTGSDITWTVQSDKSVKGNGTTTTTNAFMPLNPVHVKKGVAYKLTGCPAGGSADLRVDMRKDTTGLAYTDCTFVYNPAGDTMPTDYGNGCIFVPNNDIDLYFNIRISSGKTLSNMVFKLMLCDASIDADFHPYNPQSIQNQINDKGVLGAKNLLNNIAVSGTVRTIPVTVNADKSVSFAAGTVSGGSLSVLVVGTSASASGATPLPSTLKAGGTYKVSCKGATNTLYYNMYVWDNNNANQKQWLVKDNNTVIFTIPTTATKMMVELYANNGATIPATTLYPQITEESDPDDTYVPYAMTNRELTEITESSVTTSYTVSTTQGGNHLYKSGRIVQMLLTLEGVTADAWTTLGMVPDGYKPVTTMGAYTTRSAQNPFFVSPTGSIQVGVALTNANLNFYATWLAK